MPPLSSALEFVRRIVRSPTVVYTALAALSRASSILLGPFLTRRLSPAEYGDLSFYQSAAAVVSMFLSLGLQAAVSRFYFDGSDRSEALARAGGIARWLLVLSVGLGLCAAGAIAILPLDGVTRHHLSMTLLSGVGASLIAIPLGLSRARQRRLSVAAFAVLEFGGLVAATVALVGPGERGLDGALEALAVSGTLGALAATGFILRLPGRLELTALKRALRFSLPFVPHFIANQLLTIGDRWFLKANGLESQLGPYALASQLAAPIGMVVGAHNESASARLGETVREGGIARLAETLGAQVRNYLALTGALCALTLLATPLVPIIFSSRFSEAVWFIPLLLVSLMIESIYYPATNALFYANATSRIPLLTGVSGVTSLLLNLVLIPRFGPWGALGARFAAMSVRSALALVFARRAIRVTSAAPR